MPPLRYRRLGPAALAFCALPSLAGTSSPLDAAAPTRPLAHHPAFVHYRRHVDPVPLEWKASNDNVARIGGWRAHAHEANMPAGAPPEAPAASPGHQGHGKAPEARP